MRQPGTSIVVFRQASLQEKIFQAEKDTKFSVVENVLSRKSSIKNCCHTKFSTQKLVMNEILNWLKRYLRISWHLVKASPVKPGWQRHSGRWLTTLHKALTPQVPMQGFLHFWFEQASFILQSLSTIHSGLHVGGFPIKPGKQEQTAWPFISRHWLFGPHGDGLQGCTSMGAKISIKYLSKFNYNIDYKYPLKLFS